MDQIIDTAHFPERDRFAFWQEVNSKRHLQYDIERLDPDMPFHAKLQAAILDDILFGMACLSAIRGHRSAQHIAKDSRDHYVLGIPTGQASIMQDDYGVCPE